MYIFDGVDPEDFLSLELPERQQVRSKHHFTEMCSGSEAGSCYTKSMSLKYEPASVPQVVLQMFHAANWFIEIVNGFATQDHDDAMYIFT